MKNKKNVLITGASKGLGRYSAIRFWDEGYNLCLVSRNKKELNLIKKELTVKEEQEAHIFGCDLSNKADLKALVDYVYQYFSHLNVLINNAAIQGPIGPFSSNDLHEWEKTLSINFSAPIFLCHAFIPLMKNLKDASIINLSGGGATSSRPNFSAYAASKTALVRFSETLAEELKEDNIRVNCVSPGAMDTDMLKEIIINGKKRSGEKEYAIASKILKDGGASMSNVTDLFLFLSSDLSRNITGKLISAVWDNWLNWPNHLNELNSLDIYSLRRITGKDRGCSWGDN
jgi:NAD(P)-dependent dehydrogenase (short-subunit alcohol dehydrogenase family)